jgi:hypothetical protein
VVSCARKCGSMFGSERRPAQEKSYPGHLHYPGCLSTGAGAR